MEQKTKLITPEIDIISGKSFRFTDNNKETVIVVEPLDDGHHTIVNPAEFSLSKVITHHRRNHFLEALNVNWVYNEIVYPELYLTSQYLNEIVEGKIPDAVSFCHQLLKEYNLHPYINSQEFLLGVLQNKNIDTFSRLNTCCQLIKVLSNRGDLNKLHKYTMQAFNDPERADIIEKFANADIKINPEKTTAELERDWLKSEVLFIGNIELPVNFFLCKSFKDLRESGCNMWYIKESRLGDKMMYNKTFYLSYSLNDEKILFEIKPIDRTKWFSFRCTSGDNGKNIDNVATTLGYFLAKQESQDFFQSNYHNINLLNLNERHSFNEILDNVL